jgi:O-antigen/teichoic acid export membrane protein
MTRTRRSFWTYFTSTGFSLITVLVALVSTPLLLRWLGEERFGAYRAASDWTGYLGLFELGLAHALLPLLARSLGRSDADSLRSTLAAGIRAYAWIAMTMLAGGIALALAIPHLVPVTTGVRSDLQRGFWLGLLVILLVPLSPFRQLAEAGQKGYLVNGLLILQSLIITGLALTLAYSGWGITGQSLAAVAGAAVFSVSLAIVTGSGLQKHTRSAHLNPCPASQRPKPAPAMPPLPLIRLAAGRTSPASRAELWELNWASLIHNTCGRISLLTDNIVIAALLGPAAVVPFFLTQRLALLAQGQLQGIGNSSWAGLAKLNARGEREAANDRLVDLTSLVALLGVAGLVPIIAYNRHFVSLWVPDSRFGGELLTLLAVTNGFLQALFSLWGWVFCGTGQVARLVPMLVAGTALNLSASLAGTWLFGLPGPLLGTSISFAGLYLWLLPLLLRKHFGTSPQQLFQAVLRPIGLGLPFAAFIWWIANTHEPHGWMALVGQMVLTSAAYLFLAWWAVLNASERTYWSQRVRSVTVWPFRRLQSSI